MTNKSERRGGKEKEEKKRNGGGGRKQGIEGGRGGRTIFPESFLLSSAANQSQEDGFLWEEVGRINPESNRGRRRSARRGDIQIGFGNMKERTKTKGGKREEETSLEMFSLLSPPFACTEDRQAGDQANYYISPCLRLHHLLLFFQAADRERGAFLNPPG